MFSWLASLFRGRAEPPKGKLPAAPIGTRTATAPDPSAATLRIEPPPAGAPGPSPSAGSRIAVEISESAAETLVRIKGDARVAEAALLEARLRGIQAIQKAQVVFDLSELNFISSLAMGVLVTCRRGIIRNGGRVRFVPKLTEFVQTALGHAGLLEMFEISPAADQAHRAPGQDVENTAGQAS
jgi:anti-anti-sigma factor